MAAQTIAVAPRKPIGAGYLSGPFYDEMLASAGQPRSAYRRLFDRLQQLGVVELGRRHQRALRTFRNHGITFAVYPDEQGIEKVFPFDVIPRVISARAWRRLEAGLRQRVQTLNHFLEDIYGRKRILRQRAIPPEVVLSSPQYMREMHG